MQSIGMPYVDLDIAALVRPHSASIHTRHFCVAQGALARASDVLRAALPAGRWHLVADATTWALAGPALSAQLRNAGISHVLHVMDDARPAPTMEAVEALHAALDGSTAALALGAGTINDLVKMAAHRAGIPYAAVATAPSMNGYTSAIAALLEDGVKTTRPCTPPIAVVADIDLLAAAPYRMIAAGFGDLISKPVSQADWLLAHHLTDAPYSAQAAQLIDASAALLDGMATQLPQRAPEAVGRLVGSLLLSGLSMAVAGSSAPSSGGEHLISHYFDMTHYAFGQPNDLHGCQVGVATATTAALYEKLLALDPAHIDRTARTAALLPWAIYRRTVETHFAQLAPAVLPHAEQGYPSRSELNERLQRLQAHWSEIVAALAATLRPAADIIADLTAAGAPTTFAELGVLPQRVRCALLHGKDIRARYTILHLLSELGVLEDWSDSALEERALLY